LKSIDYTLNKKPRWQAGFYLIKNQLEIYSASPNASSGAKIIARRVSPTPNPVPLPNALARAILIIIIMTMFTKGISNNINHQTGLLIIFKRTIKL
jgi:hypothetical protein